jgi:DNA polymerase-3 subunit chi
MSKQVDFYLINNQVADAKFKLACRLSNKLQKLKKKTLILTEDAATRDKLNDLLWSFSGTSFIAHEVLGSLDLDKSVVHIGENAQIMAADTQLDYDVLINLSQQLSPQYHHFARIAEIIEQEEQERASGRLRYSNYKQEGFQLRTHHIEL